MQSVIWSVYIFGLMVPLIFIKKKWVGLVTAVDTLFLIFVFLYIATVTYTISDDYRTKLLLMAIMPLYYFNAKIVVRQDLLALLMKYVMTIFLGFSVYLLLWLSAVGFHYRSYLDYTDALFKASYLDTTIYSVVLVLFLVTRKKRTMVGMGLTLYFLFITLVSGSRFAILYVVSVLMLYMLASMRKVKQISTKGVITFVLGLVLVASALIAYQPKIEVGSYFKYTAQRLESMLEGDNSIEARVSLINNSLVATNSNTFLGHGIGSSAKILGFDYAHNMILETWMESGLINATLLVGILLYGGYRAIGLVRRGGEGAFIGFAYVYLALSHMKSFSVTDSRMLVLFYGAIIANTLMEKKRAGTVP